MKKSISKDISTKLKAIGIYQIAGGVPGIAWIIWFLAESSSVTGVVLLTILFAVGLYSYSIYCGIVLLKQKEIGPNLSLINQYLQLVHISVFGYGFQYAAGVNLSIGIDWTNSFNFIMSLGMSTADFSFNIDKDIVIITINVAALFMIVFIDKLKNKIAENKMLTEVSQIGSV